MVVRVYVSGISGNKEVSSTTITIFSMFIPPGNRTVNSAFTSSFQVKKRQQRVTMILESKNIKYNVIDITEPGKENEKEFMQENSKARDSKHPLPPQIFNDERYCGVIP